MRPAIFVVLIVFSAGGLAQDPAKPPPQVDQDTLFRLRTEGAAGGTRPLKPQEQESADVGAGPHREFKPGGASGREQREESAERDESRGASAGQGLQSGDARPGAPRP